MTVPAVDHNHQQQHAATAVAVAVDDLNRALLEADRAGLEVELAVLESPEKPAVRRVIARAVPATGMTTVAAE